MTHSKASICNDALGLLGKPPLVVDASAPQEYANADHALRAYDQRLGRVLRRHLWNFAETLVALEADGTAPPFGYSYRYALPPQCARVWKLDEARHGKDPDYKVRGGYIETNESGPLHLIYIKRVDDPALFDDEFAAALADEIAAKIAVKVLGSLEAADFFDKRAEKSGSSARTTDAQENPPQTLDEGSFLYGRRTG